MVDRKHTMSDTPNLGLQEATVTGLSSCGQTSLGGGQTVPDSSQHLLTSRDLPPGSQPIGGVVLHLV